MAATNLYPYADVFRCKDIKGSDLTYLDKEKLVVSSFFLPISITVFFVLDRIYQATVRRYIRQV